MTRAAAKARFVVGVVCLTTVTSLVWRSDTLSAARQALTALATHRAAP